MNWEAVFKVVLVGIGGGIGWLFGGWSGLLPILLIFMVIDQVSGLLASYVEGKLSSKVGFKGIAKKVMILCIIIVCNLIDQAFIIQHIYSGQIVRDGAVFFYLGNELLSFIENAGRMGVPLPEQLTNAVAVLKGKTDKNDYKPL
jgi:toxin secretion/phage lysis holin